MVSGECCKNKRKPPRSVGRLHRPPIRFALARVLATRATTMTMRRCRRQPQQNAILFGVCCRTDAQQMRFCYCASHKNWIRNIRFSIMNRPLSQ